MKNAQNNRHVRVFISSTFRDMHKERDILIKKIFPKLRKRCKQRGVEFTEVDLRWGVTEEQAERGEVLPICLKEIENTRPYFICLLGDRYGWIPPAENLNPSIFETQSWLKNHLDKSVTEMEIIHGVLNNPKMNERAFFYFRDTQYVKQLQGIQINDFKENDPRLVKKLETLKDKIRNSGFKLLENYGNPEEVANSIFEDLWEVIDKEFPAGSEPDPLAREILEHERFAESRRRVYIGRNEYFDRLDDHARKNEMPLIVEGESGSGKTALVANWVERFRLQNPNVFILQHYIGSSVQSTNYIAFLKRIMQELKLRFNIQLEIPKEPKDLIKDFPNWLNIAASNGKIILVLDGLNQLENIDNAHELYWLPEIFPPEIKIIISILPGKVNDVLSKRGWLVYTVTGLRSSERRALITEYLSHYRKSLDEKQLKTILEKEQTQNPLYLKALLDELRVFGVYEQLNDRISYYLEAKNPAELYEKILQRLEDDFETDRPHLVQDALSLVWASRMGITENELLEILGENENPLPQAIWSPLFLTLEDSLVNRQGLLDFFHDYLRNAVYTKYIQNEKNEQGLHEKLASYFDRTELDSRKIDELPWQYMKAGNWKKLASVLQDLDFINEALEKNEYEIKEYWIKTEHKTGLSLIDAYSEIIAQPEKYDFAHLNLPTLLYDMGYNEEAYSLWKYLYSILGDDFEYIHLVIGKMAAVLRDWGRLEEAMELYKKEEQICKDFENKSALQTCLHNQALILGMQGHVNEAFEQFKQGEQLARKNGDKYKLAVTLVNQSRILQGWSKLEEALEISYQAEKLFQEIGDMEGQSIILGNRALILKDCGHLDEAMTLIKQVEQMYRKFGNKDKLCSNLMAQGQILHDWGKLDESMEMYKLAEQLSKELGNKELLNKTLDTQAGILFDKGELDEALRVNKMTELVFRELDDKDSLATNFHRQASIFTEWGKTDEAMKLLKQSENICTELDNKKGLEACWTNQAIILQGLGKLEEAQALNKQAEQLCIEIKNKQGLQTSLMNQGTILIKLDKPEEGFEKYKQAENIARELKSKEGLKLSLYNQALILAEWEKWEEAGELFNESEQLCRELGNKSELIEKLDTIAIFQIKSGQKEKASDTYYKAEELCREIGNNVELQKLLASHARFLGSLEKLEEAMVLFQEEEKLCRLVENKEGLQANLSFQALILTILEKKEEALDVYKQEAELCRELGEASELLENFENQRNILTDLNRNEDVLEIFDEEEFILKQLNEKEKLAFSLGNHALLLSNLDRFEEAMKLHAEGELLFQEVGNQIGQSISILNQALIHKEWGNLEKALELHKQEELLCRQAEYWDGLQRSLGFQGLILNDIKRFSEALILLQEQEKIAREQNIELQEIYPQTRKKLEGLS